MEHDEPFKISSSSFSSADCRLPVCAFVDSSRGVPLFLSRSIGCPGPSSVLPAPGTVPGKEFSDVLDRSAAPALDPEQVILWDGAGGVTDGADFTGSRPTFTPDSQIDALAHRRDILYQPLRADMSYLLFSTGNGLSPAGSGMQGTTEPAVIGFAGDINFETPGAPTKGIWASGPMIDGMTIPADVDGLEIWGPEPPLFDTDRYSLTSDSLSGTSVWTGSGVPYIAHATIVSAVTSLLGPLPRTIDPNQIDLDALMSNGSDDEFDTGDSITFSIRQIPVPSVIDPDGFYATGSELFNLDFLPAGPMASFFMHGGHLWDHTYSLLAMKETTGRQLDVNAIEAASAVPEPSAFFFLSAVGLFVVGVRIRAYWRLQTVS